MHIGDLQKIDWIRQRVEDPNFIPSDKNKLLKAMAMALSAESGQFGLLRDAWGIDPWVFLDSFSFL